MLLPIIQTGNPILRAVARALTLDEIRSTELQNLIGSMKETMRAAPGVGLAAPQLGVSLQLVVIEDDADVKTKLNEEELNLRERTPVPFHVLINPTMKVIGEERVEFFEGCLSVAGFAASTQRFRRVSVTALNEHGEEFTKEATGWYARIIQHELDHLNGTLYIDRMDSKTFATVENKAKFWD
jgi:peptide deformylase